MKYLVVAVVLDMITAQRNNRPGVVCAMKSCSRIGSVHITSEKKKRFGMLIIEMSRGHLGLGTFSMIGVESRIVE